MALTQPLLTLEQVTCRYPGAEPDAPPALDALSVSLFSGQRVAVLGDNGAGKSTFFLCCGGVLAPRSGQLCYRGRRLGQGRADLKTLRRAVGLVFQDPERQIIGSTVEAEVSFGPLNLSLPRPEVEARVNDALDALALSPLRRCPPHALSGGQKKRVTIADLLAMRPELLLLDEPTASLDWRNADRLEQTLDELHRAGLGLVVSTHDVDFAWRWAERLLIFSEGRLLYDGGPPDAFLDDELLRRAGLRRPTLLEAALSLCRAAGRAPTASLPRQLTEFDRFVEELL